MKRILVAVLLLAAFVGIGNSKNFSVVGVVVDSLENLQMRRSDGQKKPRAAVSVS